MGIEIGAAGASPPLKVPCCRWACWISFWLGGCLNGTAMPNCLLVLGLGLSRPLSGLFSYPCLPPPSPGFVVSADFLLREKVAMERGGLGAGGAAACFSGEKDSATVADGVLLCEDEEAEVLVEKERERRNEVPMSATDDEMLCREACFLRGGVEGNLEGGSYRLGRSGCASTALEAEELGVVERSGLCGGVEVREAVEELLEEGFDLWPKKEGRRVKMAARDEFAGGVESFSSAILNNAEGSAPDVWETGES